MSVTLAVARAALASRIQEFLSGVATGGSTTTIIDTNNLTHADDYWAEAQVLMTSGTNDGLIRRVQTFTSASATLTLYSALTASVAAAATFELYRRFGPTDCDLALNRAINVSTPDFIERVRADQTTTRDTYSYAFPTAPGLGGRGLVGIEYGTIDPVITTKPLTRLPAEAYEVIEDYVVGSTNANVKTLQLKFNPNTADTIRFIFDGPIANVTLSSDRIHLDAPELEFLYSQAAAEMWRIEASRVVDANRKAALEELARWETNADRLRRQLGLVRKQTPLRRTVFRTVGL